MLEPSSFCWTMEQSLTVRDSSCAPHSTEQHSPAIWRPARYVRELLYKGGNQVREVVLPKVAE
jgi:hypothetical protein